MVSSTALAAHGNLDRERSLGAILPAPGTAKGSLKRLLWLSPVHLGLGFTKPLPLWSEITRRLSAPHSEGSATVRYWNTSLSGTTDKFWLVSGEVAESQLTGKNGINLCAGGILWKCYWSKQQLLVAQRQTKHERSCSHEEEKKANGWTEVINMNLNHGTGQTCGMPYGNSEQNRKLGTKWN